MFFVLIPTSSDGELIAFCTCSRRYFDLTVIPRLGLLLELCFENKRFWDIRRWQMPLAETAKGIRIDKVGENLNYTVIDVENRNYKEYMNYGPIPYSEVLKWSNLKQNKGW